MSIQHFEAFKADLTSIHRRFREKSSSLNGLLVHLRATCERAERFDDVEQAIGHCRKRTDKRIAKYRPALERLVSVWGTDEPYPADLPASGRGPGRGAARALVAAAKKELETMKGFVSGDAVQFPGCIHPAKRKKVLAAAKAFANKAGVQVGGTGAAVAGLGSPRWQSGMLQRSYGTVTRNRAGVCTTFAHTAAHILDKRHGTARIEIVSFRNHVFVVVGREGGYDRKLRSYVLPNYSTWSGDWHVVDGWAGAMGHEVVYRKTVGYPYIAMMHPLTLVMANDFDE